MDKLEAIFTVEKDTKNTRRYQEQAGSGPPIINTLYVQKWALEQLGKGKLPERIKVVGTAEEGRPGALRIVNMSSSFGGLGP